MTVFLRALEELNDKEQALRRAIRADNSGTQIRFASDPRSFSAIPGSPFAYWVSDELRALFVNLPLYESEDRVARRGVNTNDDARFLRVTWECYGPEWTPHVKGGVWSPFYADPHMLLKWGSNGEELRADRVTTRVYKSAIVPSRELYGRPGLTWSRRTKSELSFRLMPVGCIFGDKGPASFVEGDCEDDLLCLTALGNSKAFRALVELQLAAADAKAGGAAHSYEVGVIQRTPVPDLNTEQMHCLAQLAREAWELKRRYDTQCETSHVFTFPALLQTAEGNLLQRCDDWVNQNRRSLDDLSRIQDEIDRLSFDCYGIAQADRETIQAGFQANSVGDNSGGLSGSDADSEADEEADSTVSADVASLSSDLVGWSVGVALGRFDLRSDVVKQKEGDTAQPFAPLPRFAPAILVDENGAPACDPPVGYPISFPKNGILVDDPGHPLDITSAVRGVFDFIFEDSADEWWTELGAVLPTPDKDLRTWIREDFFDHHLKRHSKSRRKAPIIWQLSIPSGRYSIWLYAHRLSRDSFLQIQNDLLGPKLLQEERQYEALRQAERNGGEDKRTVEIQMSLVEELRGMLDEVKRIAPIWSPLMSDGAMLTMSPLWRLLTNNKASQREVKSRWEDLAAGKFDWSHVAMHLWPERVIPKCADDRSLAIAHGLDGVLWLEDKQGDWKINDKAKSSIPELVRQRSSANIKSALKSLMEAPDVAVGTKRTRKSKAA